MGSGSTLVAAARLGRRYVGYDLDPAYAEIARRRVAEEATPPSSGAARTDTVHPAPQFGEAGDGGEAAATAAADDGLSATKVAAAALVAAGFVVEGENRKLARTSTTASLLARDTTGRAWHVKVAGPHVAHRGGLQRAEVVWRTLGEAAAIRGRYPEVPLLVLTTALPRRSSEGDIALRAAGPSTLFDVVDVLAPDAVARLGAYAAGATEPRAGFWTAAELEGRRA